MTASQTGPERQPGSDGQGQQRPEYGAMRSQYPGYDPYLYGPPDDDQKNDARSGQSGTQNAAGQGRTGVGPTPGATPPPWGPWGGQPPSGQAPYGQTPYGQPPYGQPGQAPGPYGPGNGAPGQQPAGGPDGGRAHRYRNGIDLDDPRQNPLYGHWDPYAIIAFVLSLLFLTVPVLPAVMGGMAMWRTRTFRMKGFGLGLAAVIINVIATLAVLWLTFSGMSPGDLVGQMTGSGSGGGDDSSVSV